MIFYLILKLKRKEKNPQQYSFGKFILKNGKRLRLTTFSYLFIFKLMKKKCDCFYFNVSSTYYKRNKTFFFFLIK